MSDEIADILIVDDRAENLLALEAILEPLSQRITRASSGEEALRKLLTRDFAVILLDVQMPGMNGFETATMIKDRERTRHIPIVFLTAINKEEQYVFQGYAVGAVDYLSKPFQPDILRSKVATFIDLHLRQKRIAQQEQLLRESQKREMELRHMRELLQSEKRYSEIVGTAMDAIVAFDDQGTVTLFNRAAQEMFGCGADSAVGSGIERFFPEDVSAATVGSICSAARAPATGTTHTGGVTSFTARRCNGEQFPVEVSVSCGEVDERQSYTLILRDVSERVRQEEALRRQATSLERTMKELTALNEELNRRQVELEHAMTARSRFYASMSHELRTPINAVLGYSTLLLENIYGPLNEKQQEGIERTQRAARHLLELVNDVLDLSKIEAGKIDLRLQPVAFPSLLEDLFVTVRPLADQYHCELSLDHTGGEVKIVSDPRRVRQILLNLISNAVKFGTGKPVTVVSRVTDDGGLVIEVSDQGIGIAPEDQERIFQEFVQLGKTQLHEGTGLGLPISRRLAELLNGTLTLSSEPGKGSTFCLRLPPQADLRDVSPAKPDREVAAPPVRERGGEAPREPARDGVRDGGRGEEAPRPAKSRSASPA